MVKYNFGKVTKESSTVKVSFDESIIDPSKIRTPEEAEALAKEYRKEKKDLIGGDKLAKLGNESALGKDERLFKLRVGIENGRFVTVKSAMVELQLSKATIVKYARELNLPLLDTDTGKWLLEERLDYLKSLQESKK